MCVVCELSDGVWLTSVKVHVYTCMCVLVMSDVCGVCALQLLEARAEVEQLRLKLMSVDSRSEQDKLALQEQMWATVNLLLCNTDTLTLLIPHFVNHDSPDTIDTLNPTLCQPWHPWHYGHS